MAAYVIQGEGVFGAPAVRAAVGSLAVFSPEGALRLSNRGGVSLDVMLLGGAPVEGPLVFHGPFVMNNVEQIRAAEVAYRTGRMGVLED